jgi:hypothetical protein
VNREAVRLFHESRQSDSTDFTDTLLHDLRYAGCDDRVIRFMTSAAGW